MSPHNSVTTDELLLEWNRVDDSHSPSIDQEQMLFTPQNTRGHWLWHRGMVANRAALIRNLNISPSTNDHKLIIYLYKFFGVDFIKKISGPISVILWDNNRRILFGARDRMGVHGLYYVTDSSKILLSPSIEHLLRALSSPPSANIRSLVAHIAGYPPLPSDTFYEHISEVEPGCILQIDQDRMQIKRYWNIDPRPRLKFKTDEEYANAFRCLLFEVVAGYLSNQPSGITLSGGLDSTTVAAAIRAIDPDIHLTAIRWISPELPEADENAASSLVAQHLAIPSLDIRADLLWPLSNPGGIVTSPASPFCNYYREAWTATYNKACQHGIRVLFSGLGGDHLFGGNVFSYPDLLLTGRWLELIRQIRTHLPHSPNQLSWIQVIKQIVLIPIIHTYWPQQNGWRAPPAWMTKKAQTLYEDLPIRSSPLFDMLPGRQQRLKALRDHSLPRIAEHITTQALRYGVDFRHPLLDHRLIEFALALPTTQTFRAMRRKIVVRNAMWEYLPSKILEAWDKTYPTAIMHRGLRERERDKLWALMTDMRSAEMGLVNENLLQQAYNNYLNEKGSELFWYTLTLENWLRLYF